ncbi:hypothetical protein PENFLA_c021G06507 [Penicillium flavigenum]|uniref:Uncharacterized protein n=1 Tax=Penicillium flavigenum TaxID=254877 RepID=A0A1V6SX15_9EURO|nr:hypothetical protein PENFLA_c021G06507 [Penicillium flavigenum]
MSSSRAWSLDRQRRGPLSHTIGAGSYSKNGTVVSEAHAPSWMQSSAQKVVSGLSSIKKVIGSDKLAPINVEVKWVRGTNVARYMETEAAIEKALEREVALPPSKFRPPWDPRVSVSKLPGVGSRSAGHPDTIRSRSRGQVRTR